LNDARLCRHDVDVCVEVEELEGHQQADPGKLMPGAEPTQVQDFVQGYAELG
jgi:hypothetical protein